MLQASLQWLQIQVTPAGLAPGSIQAAELHQIAERQRRDLGGGLDRETLTEIGRTGWMRQDVHSRGAYLSTSGLGDRLDHPELVIMNIPSGAVDWASSVLNAMASYLDESGARFQPGDIFAATGTVVDEPFTFAPLSAEGAESIGFGAGPELMVVIPLP